MSIDQVDYRAGLSAALLVLFLAAGVRAGEALSPDPVPAALPVYKASLGGSYDLKRGKRTFKLITDQGVKEKQTEEKTLANRQVLQRKIKEIVIPHTQFLARPNSCIYTLAGDKVLITLYGDNEQELKKRLRHTLELLAMADRLSAQKTDPDVDQRAHKIDPKDLVSGAVQPGIGTRVYVRNRISAFLKANPLTADESVSFDDKSGFVRYRLRQSYVPKLVVPLGAVRGKRKVEFHPEATAEVLEPFKKLLDNSYEHASFDAKTHYIQYTLSQEHEEELWDLLATADKKPYQLTIQVMMLSVTRDAQTQLGTQFGFDARHTYSSSAVLKKNSQLNAAGISGTTNPNAISVFNLGYVTPLQKSVNIMIDSIVTRGEGRRHNLPDLVTIEHYKKNMKPIVFKKKVNVPVTTITADTVDTKTVEVGLGLRLNNIHVIETDAFLRAKRRFEQKYARWLFDNRELLTVAAEVFGQGRVDLKRKYDFSGLCQMLQKHAMLRQEERDVSNLLEIQADAVLEDGGITRITQTAASTNVEYENVSYDFHLVLRNNEPAFLGGTNEASASKTVSGLPGLHRIPGLRYLLGGRKNKQHNLDSVVSFVTISVNHDLTASFASAKYNSLGQRFAIPMSLGGYAQDGLATHPLKTGRRSRLRWMYGDNGHRSFRRSRKATTGVYPRAVNRLNIMSPVAKYVIEKFISRRFFHLLILPITQADAITQEADWLDFKTLKMQIELLDNYIVPKGLLATTHGYDVPPGLGVAYVMETIQKELKHLAGAKLTLTELLSIIRHAGRIGRGANPKEADERLTLYLAWLIAVHTGADAKGNPRENQVFATEKDLHYFRDVALKAFNGKRSARMVELYCVPKP